MSDTYQDRYLAHQKRKAAVLGEIMRERHSNRRFANEPVDQKSIDALLKAKELAPSSCDRQAIKTILVTQRDDKALLGGVLVGGVGWIHRAPAILLLFADGRAYKADNEISYMPYLDAGVVIQSLYLAATSLGLHSAYANPNIRVSNTKFFLERFIDEPEKGPQIFCGAFAFGKPLVENIEQEEVAINSRGLLGGFLGTTGEEEEAAQ